MKPARGAIFVFLLSLLIATPLLAGGYARDERFIVLARDQTIADEVLALANACADEFSREWLGAERFESTHRTWITVELSGEADRGLFWPVDDPQRRLHRIWLTTNADRALGSTLRHEMTHLVLAAQLPSRLPAWADEGAASLQDDPQRIGRRRQILQSLLFSGQAPDLQSIFQAESIAAADQTTYAVATSLAEYLISLGGKPRLVRFAADGPQLGWDEALRSHYNIRSVAELQTAWRTWATQSAR